jgi:xanthine/CO dehydrogenase XdhC/CoxF family maturation factor
MSEWAKLVEFGLQRRALPLAFASVVRTRGSSYRRAGARMLVAPGGESAGAVSGGCLEEEIIARAEEVLQRRKSRLCLFETRVRQGCHGTMEVLIEALPPEEQLLAAIGDALRSRQAALLRTTFGEANLGSGRSGLISGESEEGDPLTEVGQQATIGGPLTIEVAGTNDAASLYELIVPPVRLIVVGAGLDAVPVAELGQQLGWKVEVVAHPVDRPVLSPTLIAATASDAMQALSPDRWTAVVLISHHYVRDLEYLRALLPLDFPYLGLLGPRKRREQLLAELIGFGFEPLPENLAKLRSPCGLDLGGDSPAEIALSIIAEIQAVLAGRDAAPLSCRRGGIHTPPLPTRTRKGPSAIEPGSTLPHSIGPGFPEAGLHPSALVRS